MRREPRISTASAAREQTAELQESGRSTRATQLVKFSLFPEADIDHLEPAIKMSILLDAFAGVLYRAHQQQEMGMFGAP